MTVHASPSSSSLTKHSNASTGKYDVMSADVEKVPIPAEEVEERPTPTTKSSGTEDGGGGFLHSLKFRLLILVWYSIQNTVHILLMSYTRQRNVKEVYYPEVAAFMTEVFKVVLCLFMISLDSRCNPLTVYQKIRGQLLKQPLDTLKIGLPALLYTIQNIILYYAASHLSATAFMITLQLKLMSAAIFSVILLGRRLKKLHWIALSTLFIGVCIVQVTSAKQKHHTAAVGQQVPMLGFALTVTGCLTSGFSGVFLERIYKKGYDTSIWMRNIQMSVFMLPISLFFVGAKNYHKIMETRFFYGFDWVVWFLIFWLSVGGLTVGVCIKFADNITKDMATSIAIILSTIASVMFLHFTTSWLFGLGAAMVITSIFLYSYTNRIVEAVDVATNHFGGVMNGPKRSHQQFLEKQAKMERKQSFTSSLAKSLSSHIQSLQWTKGGEPKKQHNNKKTKHEKACAVACAEEGGATALPPTIVTDIGVNTMPHSLRVFVTNQSSGVQGAAIIASAGSPRSDSFSSSHSLGLISSSSSSASSSAIGQEKSTQTDQELIAASTSSSSLDTEPPQTPSPIIMKISGENEGKTVNSGNAKNNEVEEMRPRTELPALSNTCSGVLSASEHDTKL